MEHRPQRVARRHLSQQRGHRIAVADVAGQHRHRRAGAPQVGGQLGHSRRGFAAAADQHQVRHPVPGDQVTSQRRACHAGGAGDQRGAAGEPDRPIRHGQHHLADVPGSTDEPVGVGRAARVKSLDRQRRQRPGGEQLHHFGQHRRDAVRAGLHQVERPVAHPGMGPRDDVGIPQVRLTHFDEPPAGAQQPQRRIVELAGQRVEHHVHAAGGGTELLLEIQGPGIRDVRIVETHGAQRVPLAATGRGEHLRTPMPGQLHGGHAHPAGGGVHQHPLPGPQPGQHRQPVIRRQEHHRDAGGLSHRPAGRHPGHQPAVDGGFGAHQPEDAHHRVTDGHIGDTGADLGHDPGALGAQLGRTRIHPQRHQHIPEVHPGRGHPHPHLPGCQLRGGVFLHRQVFERPGVAGGQPPHRRRPGQFQQRPPPGGSQPGAVGHAVAHHQLRFAATDHRGKVQRAVGVDQHHPARVLGLRRAHQSPHRRAGQIRDVLPRQTHRAAGRHHQHAARLAGEPGLQHAQRLMRGRMDRGRSGAIDSGGLPDRDAFADWVVGQRVPRLDHRPRHVQQLTAAGAGRHGRGQLLRRHGAGHQLPHRQHGDPRRVGQFDRHGAGAGRRQPDPDPRRAGRVQAHALPGERQHRLQPLVGHP
ncbi:hypothetical protein PICSAR190_04511 [Mycobacterium avium subsp. paratuberculosis]|nr:hypothetical protein PICSAR190_04511 [Mycobacterium avium subsp. paratuberculosis]